MPRIARVVVPGMPHHVTQRGNRRANVFFDDGDRRRYLLLLEDYARKYGLAVWAYCLMTNHVHFVAVPASEAALGRSFRDSHQAYSSWLNRRLSESGHLWQGRFFSSVLDDAHLWACVRYVERNPVRAGLVARAEDWPWSSAAAHCGRRTDPLLSPIQMPWPVADWTDYLRTEDEKMVEAIRRQTMTGRPSGGDGFIAQLEGLLGRILHRQKPGPKPKAGKRVKQIKGQA
ncbi:MAG: Transposase IS200 like protein [Planctomycetes bacterium ADurb.Bin126]|nr:MAG: Transposase IS200 like protein [Planctomycetes bacterium ADurb.Bin126]